MRSSPTEGGLTAYNYITTNYTGLLYTSHTHAVTYHGGEGKHTKEKTLLSAEGHPHYKIIVLRFSLHHPKQQLEDS